MNNLLKTKEQLIKELEELQQAFSSLKVSVETDKIEQRKTEEALRASEEQFQLLFNKAPLGYQSLDFDGFFIEVNQKWLDILGYKHEDVIGKWFGDFLSPAYQDGFRKRFPIFKAQGHIHSEFEMVHKSGQLLFIAFDGKIGYDLDGNFKQTHCILQDISERKLAEEKLLKSEENLSITLNSIGDGVLSTDIHGLIVRMNPVAEKLCGWDLAEATGKPLTEVFHIVNAETREKIANPARKMLENGEVVGLANHTALISKDGSEYQIADSAAPIKNKEGEISGVVLVFSDVTEKYAAQKHIEESEEKFRLLITAMDQGMALHEIITDENGTPVDYVFLDINDSYTKLFGVTREMSIGRRIREVMPKVEQYWIDIFCKVALTGEPSYYENYLETTGKYYSTYSYSPKKNQFAVLVNDITERKQAEHDLREKEVQYRNLANTGLALIWTSGPDKLCTYFNEPWLEFTGRKLEQEIGNGWAEGVHPDDFDRCLNTYVTAFDKRESFEMEYRMRHHSGEYRWILDMGTPNFNNNGDFVGYIGHCFDISERKLMERDLIIAKEHAEESDRLKSAFLANMSHEIRTPMNGILGFSEILKEQDLTGEEQQNYIDIIQNSGKRMLNIINDIIDISKIEAGLMKMAIKETNINEQIKYIYTFFKPEVEAKGMKLSFQISLPAKEATIKTDREKLYAILTNLVKNAIKYTDEGSIEFGYILKTDTLPGELEFYIKDTGIGIPKERQEAIFERFIQADIEDNKARQGAGLGLTISKTYVEMLGGKIRVESQEGIGSTFYFTLPYNAVPEEIILHPKESNFDNSNKQIKNLKILIAEDDEVSGMLIEIALKLFGKSILKAQNGLEAVEISRTNPNIDLILMDIQMPKMNGYEATRQIRQFNKEVIIIAQTACGLSGDRELALAAGCDDYIAKPVSKAELLAIIQKYLN